jgi:large subunit ribosomal protein L31
MLFYFLKKISNIMKKDIHPAYYNDAKVICACGNTFITGSTQSEIKIELCSKCHPFYTGKQKIVDTAKRVEKFQARVEAKDELSKIRKGKKVKRTLRATAKAEKEENKK